MTRRLLYDTEAAAGIPTILTVADVASLLKVGRSTIYRLIESGQLVAIRIASGYRIRLDHLHAYLDSQTTSQEAQHGTKAQRREYLPKEPRRQTKSPWLIARGFSFPQQSRGTILCQN